MCPGTVSIINNLDDLVDKCNQKINLVRRTAEDGSRNAPRIETKFNSLNLPRKFEEIALKSNRIKSDNVQPKKKKIKIKNREIIRDQSQTSMQKMSSRKSLKTISEVSNSASNLNSRSSRSIMDHSNTLQYEDKNRNDLRNKLDYFYTTDNSQSSSNVVSPKSTTNMINLDQNINHKAILNSTKMINNLVLKKCSFGTQRNTPADYSIRTSPFNKDPLDTNTNSSYLRSTKGFQSEAKQEDLENSNEDELYNLSQEKSYQSNLQEIIEIETQGDPERNSIELNEELQEYVISQNPNEMKSLSPLCSQNSHDLNRLLYQHKREESNCVSSSNVYSDIYRSNQASVADNYRNIRGSEEQSFTNYICNRYHQRNRSSNISHNEEEIVLKSADNQNFQYNCNENAEDTENQLYDGMNFEEYCKSATETCDQNSRDHKLAISDEQRENLMKRIMILKMQQNSTMTSHDENPYYLNTQYRSQCEEDEEEPDYQS